MSDFVLTDENYYTPEADMEYMSCSQFQGFDECEAKQLAKLQKRWVDESKEAFLVGNFFHSYFEGAEAHEKFCRENVNDIYSKSSFKKFIDGKGSLELLAPYQKAVQMIQVAEKDPTIMRFINMEGRNEIFMTGKIFNIPWRMKMDKYIPDKRFIIDYKTVANIWETSYDPIKGERVTFVEAYGYMFRAAAYSMIEVQNALDMDWNTSYNNLQNGDIRLPDFMLICLSKQDYPDKEIIRLNHRQAYIYELERIRDKLIHYNRIKEGSVIPQRCGKCDYCRATKQIQKIIPYYELKPEFRSQKEDDYAICQAESMV